MKQDLDINWQPSKKQLLAWQILSDKETNELLYGGGAGGGKSYLGCCWIILSCLKYADSRWLIGRTILKALKESTMLTFLQICKEWGLEREVDYKYDSINGIVHFLKTGSEVYLKDLAAQPSDPEFDDLGSREYCGAFVDEASEITTKCYNILKSRIRYKLEEFDIIPKLLICSNPCKNFLYYEFYKPSRDGIIKPYKKFLPALATDNPFVSPHYIESLKKLDKISKQRLLYGNWEYDDDDTKLFQYEKIVGMFGRGSEVGTEANYLTIDVARFGKDNTVIMQWSGLYVNKVYVYQKQSTMDTIKCIKQIQKKTQIPNSNIIIDEDGIGGALVDSEHLKGVKGFINNARAMEKKSEQNPSKALTAPPRHFYANLKSQCYFLLAKYINGEMVGVYNEVNDQVKEMLIEDLEQIREKDADKDNRIAIIPKEQIKESLGRSTDFSDSMMMRMYFELRPAYKPYLTGGMTRV